MAVNPFQPPPAPPTLPSSVQNPDNGPTAWKDWYPASMQERILQGSQLPGRYGGTMGGMNAELDATDAGIARGLYLQQRGQDIQGTMRGIGTGQMDQGAAYGNVGEGYGANARGDSDLSGADRAQSQQDLDRVRAFYEGGPGPSAAQAQLRQANDINNSATVSLARSGRGGVNPLAGRDAAFATANAGQEMNRQSKILGAQEAADWRTQQGQAMGLEQAGLGAMRAGDLNTMSGNLQGGVNAGQLGHGYSKLGSETTDAGQQLGMGYASVAESTAENAERLRQGILTDQSTAGVSRYNSLLGRDTAMNSIDAAARAGTIGAVSTGAASLADTVFNRPAEKDKP